VRFGVYMRVDYKFTGLLPPFSGSTKQFTHSAGRALNLALLAALLAATTRLWRCGSLATKARRHVGVGVCIRGRGHRWMLLTDCYSVPVCGTMESYIAAIIQGSMVEPTASVNIVLLRRMSCPPGAADV